MRRLLNNLIWLGTLVFVTQGAFSQSFQEDFKLLAKQLPDRSVISTGEKAKPTQFLLQDHPSAWVRYNPFTLSFGGLMWVYQTILSEQLSSSCIYSPTCSGYSKNLIRDYGLLYGLFLTADRLTRCNRLALYDYPLREIDPHSHSIHQETDYYKIR